MFQQYIYRAGTSRNTSYYAAYSSIYDKTYISNLTDHLQGNQNIRLATEEEKQKLFDKLKEEGLEFDFEKKELVKLRWKPKHSEEYFYPFFDAFKFVTNSTEWDRETFDFKMLDMGWCFKTQEECEEFCKKLNDCISSINP